MEHIIDRSTGRIDFAQYEKYLNSIRHHLPDHIYTFASNQRHFYPDSPSSLHDAWMESLTIREAASGKRQEIRMLEISLCLLGPFHDRLIHLHYMGVVRYSFEVPPRNGDARFEHTAHGDLLTHEIRLSRNGLFIHELSFERGTMFMIECSDIKHSEKIFSTEDACSDGNGNTQSDHTKAPH